MNAEPGGNARWSQNEITAYPWRPTSSCPRSEGRIRPRTLRGSRLLKNGQWEERYLAFSPQEACFFTPLAGSIEPAVGLKPKDPTSFSASKISSANFAKVVLSRFHSN